MEHGYLNPLGTFPAKVFLDLGILYGSIESRAHSLRDKYVRFDCLFPLGVTLNRFLGLWIVLCNPYFEVKIP